MDHGVNVALFYGDFYSTQDNLPYGIADRTQRHRIYVYKKTNKMVRIEMSKQYLNDLSEINPCPNENLYKVNPKM